MIKTNISIFQVTLIVLFLTSCNEKQPQTNISIQQKEMREGQNPAQEATKTNPEVPQTKEERIQDIKAWYDQIQLMGKRNCIERERIKNDSFSPESEAIPFTQKASKCKINEEFEVIQGNFSGYEAGSKIRIYKRNGKIFFVFIEGGGEGWSFEKRYYCDEEENVIKHIEREAENGDAITGPQIEIEINKTNPNERKYVEEAIS